jgi:hypothetical protein
MDINKKMLWGHNKQTITQGVHFCVLAEKDKRRKRGVKAQPLGQRKMQTCMRQFLLLYRSDPKRGGGVEGGQMEQRG